MPNKKLTSVAGAGVAKLQTQLATVEKAAEKLAAKAKERLPAAADVKAELPVVRERLEQAARTAVDKGRARTRRRAAAGARPVMAPVDASAPAPRAAGPDESWTVARLRAEAKARGLTGYSRKTKAELLADLRG